MCHVGKGLLPIVASLLVLGITLQNCVGSPKGSRALLYVNGKTIAEVALSKDGEIMRCSLTELEEESDALPIVANRGLPVKRPTFKNMLKLINDCSLRKIPAGHPNDTEFNVLADGPLTTMFPPMESWSLFNGIAPGTKWCGINDIASSFDDLGVHARTDACCRAHDHCPVKLKAFRSGYGTFNFGFYTRSHCDCDYDLYGCLKRSSDQIADAIGNIFFNLMNIQCLRNNRPLVCLNNKTEDGLGETCTQWGEDVNSNQMQSTSLPLKY